MPNLPDLSWVDRVYALVEEKLPIGRILAPAVGLLLLLVVVVWAGGYLWRGLVLPIVGVVGGTGLGLPPIGQMIGAGLIVLIILGVIAVVQRQLSALRREIGTVRMMVETSFTIQDAIVTGLPKDIDALRARIADLESHTDIKGLRAALTKELMTREALRGLRNAGQNFSSVQDDDQARR